MKEKERRTILQPVEIRSQDDGADGVLIEGYALKFNTLSEDLGGFNEVLDPKCLDNADMHNVVALYNHDQNLVLGRNTITEGPGSLTLSIDDVGLLFSLRLVDTTYAQDLAKNMRAGIVSQCSFAFTIAEDDWDVVDGDTKYLRTVRAIERLWDVSVVTTPAYSDTIATVGQRSLEDFKEQQRLNDEHRKQSLKLQIELYGG